MRAGQFCRDVWPASSHIPITSRAGGGGEWVVERSVCVCVWKIWTQPCRFRSTELKDKVNQVILSLQSVNDLIFHGFLEWILYTHTHILHTHISSNTALTHLIHILHTSHTYYTHLLTSYTHFLTHLARKWQLHINYEVTINRFFTSVTSGLSSGLHSVTSGLSSGLYCMSDLLTLFYRRSQKLILTSKIYSLTWTFLDKHNLDKYSFQFNLNMDSEI